MNNTISQFNFLSYSSLYKLLICHEVNFKQKFIQCRPVFRFYLIFDEITIEFETLD